MHLHVGEPLVDVVEHVGTFSGYLIIILLIGCVLADMVLLFSSLAIKGVS